MAAEIGIWSVGVDSPVRVERSSVGLEAHLEDWVAGQPSLLSEGLQVVGRQLHVDAGYIDLLCLDATGRWVIVELKRARLYRDAVVQAIDYASCIQAIDGVALRNSIEAGLDRLSNKESVLESVDYQLQSDDEDRDVAIIVAGAGVDPGMERIVTYLGRFEIPIRVVSFDVFEARDGSKLLVREVLDDEVTQTGSTSPKKTRTVTDIGNVARHAGVGEAFNQIISGAEEAGLFCRPYKHSVMITPPTHKNRYLMVVNPREGLGIRMSHGSDAFAEFFPGLSAQAVEEALGPSNEAYVLTKDEWQKKVQALVEFFQQLPEMESPEGGRRDDLIYDFHERILPKLRETTQTFQNVRPSTNYWKAGSLGVNGLNVYLGAAKTKSIIQIWFSRANSASENHAGIEALQAYQAQLEEALPDYELEWRRAPATAMVEVIVPEVGYGTEPTDPELDEIARIAGVMATKARKHKKEIATAMDGATP
jgi:hypothetical protein